MVLSVLLDVASAAVAAVEPQLQLSVGCLSQMLTSIAADAVKLLLFVAITMVTVFSYPTLRHTRV